MRIDKKIENYILEFYFNHLAIMKFRSFGSWRIQIEPQMGVWMEEKKEREKKREVQNSIWNSQMNPKFFQNMFQALYMELRLHFFVP